MSLFFILCMVGKVFLSVNLKRKKEKFYFVKFKILIFKNRRKSLLINLKKYVINMIYKFY